MISAVASKRILIMGLGDVMVSERGLGLRCPRHSQDHTPFGEGACFFLVWIQLVSGEERVKSGSIVQKDCGAAIPNALTLPLLIGH